MKRERPEPKPIASAEEARSNASYVIQAPTVKAPKKGNAHGETVSDR